MAYEIQPYSSTTQTGAQQQWPTTSPYQNPAGGYSTNNTGWGMMTNAQPTYTQQGATQWGTGKTPEQPMNSAPYGWNTPTGWNTGYSTQPVQPQQAYSAPSWYGGAQQPQYSTQPVQPQQQYGGMQQSQYYQPQQQYNYQSGGRPLMTADSMGYYADARQGTATGQQSTGQTSALGQYSYNTPTPTAQTGTALQSPTAAPGTANVNWNAYRGNTAEGINAWLGLGQFQQNQYQYTQDFNEAQRRWDAPR
jgi:hypothetical protein